MSRSDPYYLLAEATAFASYGAAAESTDAPLGISLELAKGNAVPAADGLHFRAAPPKSAFLTGRATRAALQVLLKDKRVRRVVLAEPLLPPRGSRLRRGDAPRVPLPAPRLHSARRSELLLGIVDNGCPFAHQELRDDDGTRVVSLWDQDGNVGAGLGDVPHDFGYGRVLNRADLDRLIAAATSRDGSVDEDLCYRLAGYDQVSQRQTHGAHSLGLLIGGRRDLQAALPSNFDRNLDPNGQDRAQRTPADIAFVQLPQVLMDCVSVAALEQHALDGFRHILKVGKEGGYKRVRISFGYESWVGPHDGSSWFEGAVAELFDDGLPLEIYMSAGNSRNRRAHAVLRPRDRKATVWWHVPAGNEIPVFLEVWFPPRMVTNVGIELRGPNGLCLTVAEKRTGSRVYGGQGSAQIAVCASHALGAEQGVALIRIAPTHTWNGSPRAPHGIWELSLSGLPDKSCEIHARLGRVQGDSNSPRAFQQPEFVDRFAEELRKADESGTLNGHACGKGPVVCGVFYSARFPYGKVLEDFGPRLVESGRSTSYSGAGPTGARARPDLSLPMEDGIYHEGTMSIGTRSGSVWRMRGTSTAAPAGAGLSAQRRSPRGPKTPHSDPGLGETVLETI
jgi:hypothetical protein